MTIKMQTLIDKKQTILFYHNPSVWLDTQDVSSED